MYLEESKLEGLLQYWRLYKMYFSTTARTSITIQSPREAAHTTMTTLQQYWSKQHRIGCHSTLCLLGCVRMIQPESTLILFWLKWSCSWAAPQKAGRHSTEYKPGWIDAVANVAAAAAYRDDTVAIVHHWRNEFCAALYSFILVWLKPTVAVFDQCTTVQGLQKWPPAKSYNSGQWE